MRLKLCLVQVAGNFHIAPGKSFQQGSVHVHDLVPFRTTEFDTSHTIHQLSFGLFYPGQKNPLDGTRVLRYNKHNPEGVTGAYQYFLKVWPMIRGLGTACDFSSAHASCALFNWEDLHIPIYSKQEHTRVTKDCRSIAPQLSTPYDTWLCLPIASCCALSRLSRGGSEQQLSSVA